MARTRLSGTSDNFADLILTARAHAQRCWERFAGGGARATCSWGLVAGTGETGAGPLVAIELVSITKTAAPLVAV